MSAKRFIVEDHLRKAQVYDNKRNRVVAAEMSIPLARKVAKMLNNEHYLRQAAKELAEEMGDF